MGGIASDIMSQQDIMNQQDIIDYLTTELEKANKTIDDMANFQTDEIPITKSWFKIFLSWFEPLRPFKGWDIRHYEMSSPNGEYVLRIDPTSKAIINSNKTKSRFHSSSVQDQREYYNYYLKELKYRSKGK